MSRDLVVFYELAFDFGIHVPFSRLVGPEVRADELRPLLSIVPLIVVIDHPRAV